MRICPQCRHSGDEKVCPQDGMPMIDPSNLGDEEENAPDLIGRVFGERYRVESVIGRGGMGWVFSGTHLVMQQTVALKVMRKDLCRNMSAVRRFLQEARACSQLRHHNTIKVYDFGYSDDGYPYLTMEYLEGSPLNRLLKTEGPLDPGRAARIGVQICHSLDEAHEAGMVHRDLKPGNVFLAEMHASTDYVKVLDFGIAKFIDPEGSDVALTSLTDSGMVVGTPKYLSPEQALGKDLDRRSDLYSLGIILYEMLVGKVPFDAPTSGELIVRQVRDAPPPVPPVVAGRTIPDTLRTLVHSLLAKEPEVRPDDAMKVAGYLEGISRDAPPPTEMVPTRVEAVSPQPGLAPTPAPHTGPAPAATPAPISAVSGLYPPEPQAPSDSGQRFPVAGHTPGSHEMTVPPADRSAGRKALPFVLVVLVAALLGGVLAAVMGGGGAPRRPPVVAAGGADVTTATVPTPEPSEPGATLDAAPAAPETDRPRPEIPTAIAPPAPDVVAAPPDVPPDVPLVPDVPVEEEEVTSGPTLVRVYTNPDRAAVLADGEPVGVTPCDVPMGEDGTRTITLAHTDCPTRVETVRIAEGDQALFELTGCKGRRPRPRPKPRPRPGPKPTPTPSGGGYEIDLGL